MRNDYNRVCPVCGKPIVGRSDKKYCSDLCRHDANNELRKQSDQQLLRINKVLNKNRQILKALCPSGKAIVDQQTLLMHGFNPGIFTSVYVTKQGSTYYICYDYAFTPLTKRDTFRALIVFITRELSPWDPWKSKIV